MTNSSCVGATKEYTPSNALNYSPVNEVYIELHYIEKRNGAAVGVLANGSQERSLSLKHVGADANVSWCAICHAPDENEELRKNE